MSHTHNSIKDLNIVKTNDTTQIILLHSSLIIGHSNIETNNTKLELLNVNVNFICASKMETLKCGCNVLLRIKKKIILKLNNIQYTNFNFKYL